MNVVTAYAVQMLCANVAALGTAVCIASLILAPTLRAIRDAGNRFWDAADARRAARRG